MAQQLNNNNTIGQVDRPSCMNVLGHFGNLAIYPFFDRSIFTGFNVSMDEARTIIREAVDLIMNEKDDEINPLGVKGVGEIGIVGTAAAIANAVYHATGKRIRDLPITIDKLLRV